MKTLASVVVLTVALGGAALSADELANEITALPTPEVLLTAEQRAEAAVAAEDSLNALMEEAQRLDDSGKNPRPRVLAAQSLDELRRQVLRSDDRIEAVTKPLSLCIPTVLNLCLNGRFLVVALYENQYNAPGVLIPAGARQLTTSAGYFWFFDPVNMEVPIKMVNGCFANPPGHWVFAAGLSNFGVGIGVKDMLTGVQKNYVNLPGSVFNTIIDQQTPWPCP